MAGKRGRPKGSQNYKIERVRTAITRLFEDDFALEDIKSLIARIDSENGPKDAFNCYLQLADFVLPKLQRVEHTGKDGDSLSIEHVLNTLQTPDYTERLPVPDNSGILEAELITEEEKE